jgi:ribosome-associated protein
MSKLTVSKLNKLALEVTYQYSRSSGPGGQKVNKTETRVELFWDPQGSPLFRAEEKARLLKKLESRINKQGQVFFASDQFRTRPQNKNQCFKKLVKAIEKALERPKLRKKTKPTKASVEKRIQEKKRLSDKKKMRQKI